MLTEDDIKVGNVIVLIKPLNDCTIGKEYELIEGAVNYIVFKDDLNNRRLLNNGYDERLKLFKLKLKETIMLDPEIYAIGTVHKHNMCNAQYRIIARNVKTNEFKSGIAMIAINITDKTPDPFTICQETGKFNDDNKIGLYVAPKKHKGWMNIYSDQGATTQLHKTKDAANVSALYYSNRIACIEIEYEEGQGL